MWGLHLPSHSSQIPSGIPAESLFPQQWDIHLCLTGVLEGILPSGHRLWSWFQTRQSTFLGRKEGLHTPGEGPSLSSCQAPSGGIASSHGQAYVWAAGSWGASLWAAGNVHLFFGIGVFCHHASSCATNPPVLLTAPIVVGQPGLNAIFSSLPHPSFQLHFWLWLEPCPKLRCCLTPHSPAWKTPPLFITSSRHIYFFSIILHYMILVCSAFMRSFLSLFPFWKPNLDSFFWSLLPTTCCIL